MKGLGYLISTLSVCLLGIVSWRSDQPFWKAAVLTTGMVASVLGMLLRFLSHRKDRAAIAFAQREAENQSCEPSTAAPPKTSGDAGANN
ncbi:MULTISPECIES: hypothetical protein [Sphingomonas]|uniref:hypothetical protein n=1 Tax=Sphingomonas TaxID=13687 RepID=UPI001269EF32|nr:MULTISPECIES: hypothetical protein [Sphingomonas]